MVNKLDQHKTGLLAGLGAYILWGVLPLYWKIVSFAPAGVVLAQRIFWSLVFMVTILVVMRKLPLFSSELKQMWVDKKQLLFITLASCCISLNWFVYIWAVYQDRLVEASLGYYINPLVSVVFAMFFFKERLTRAQTISFCLAAVGVLILAIYTGGLPFISLILAVSFAFYGVLKKKVEVGALTGLAVETMIVTPLALIYLSFVFSSVSEAFYLHSVSYFSLLVGSGAATALPLLLFSIGARRVPLSTLGFLQYLAPTITLFIGIFIFKEPFSTGHFFAFAFIWLALAIYTFSKTRLFKKIQLMQMEKRHAS